MTNNVSQRPPSHPYPIKGVGVQNLEKLNHIKGDEQKKIIGAIPRQQRRSATTALARLQALGKEGLVTNEWIAGQELFVRGELKRFDPAKAFFFLFSKACRDELKPLWGPALSASRQAETDAKLMIEVKHKNELIRILSCKAKDVRIHAQARAILQKLGEGEVLRQAREKVPPEFRAGITDPIIAAMQLIE